MTQLVSAFDQARTATPGITSWALTNKLLDAHLAATDSAALGGDLAYQYGKNHTLAGVGLTPAQSILGTAGFGQNVQSFLPAGQLTFGVVKLS